MKLTTRVFGEVEIEDSKIIDFPNGIIGFPDLKKFALMHDSDDGASTNTIKWLQSIDEPGFAMPVMDPLIVARITSLISTETRSKISVTLPMMEFWFSLPLQFLMT